ncbi:3'-5' exonuclease [Cephaloticoccus capnophilus]|uniref:3'-5' exonuclease n=1 Tax=Cephaloticoccus capnophilus TaxID=1548208 RepID=A0A139SQ38_9BACT|nr:ribonuclease D [Cephaloticoccus capnophilus]KXU36709.1 3'-5' exonuclease [Cephaloticoccus capnophilus]
MIARYLPAALRRLFKITVPSRPPAYTLIDQPGQLAPLLTALSRVSELALDTEADNMYHYKTRVCLLQFLVGKEVFMVDAQAPLLKLDALWEALADKHLIMHGSDFDLRLLYDLCRFSPRSIFDTMLAAQLLNRPRVGLASLLEAHFQVKLSKDSQKANWSKRPLTQKMLDYAALDVWHLPALRDILTRELERRGRLPWLKQQCEAQIKAGLSGFAPRDENAWRIGKSEKLKARGLSVLHAVWHWREETAERLDVPAFKVCNADRLLTLAQAADAGDSLAAILARVHLGRRHERLLPTLTAAVTLGLERDPQTIEVRRKRRRDPDAQPLTQAEVELQQKIREDRDRLAQKLSLEPTLIANRTQLARIAREPRALDEILLPWQAELIRSMPALQGV